MKKMLIVLAALLFVAVLVACDERVVISHDFVNDEIKVYDDENDLPEDFDVSEWVDDDESNIETPDDPSDVNPEDPSETMPEESPEDTTDDTSEDAGEESEAEETRGATGTTIELPWIPG